MHSLFMYYTYTYVYKEYLIWLLKQCQMCLNLWQTPGQSISPFWKLCSASIQRNPICQSQQMWTASFPQVSQQFQHGLTLVRRLRTGR